MNIKSEQHVPVCVRSSRFSFFPPSLSHLVHGGKSQKPAGVYKNQKRKQEKEKKKTRKRKKENKKCLVVMEYTVSTYVIRLHEELE